MIKICFLFIFKIPSSDQNNFIVLYLFYHPDLNIFPFKSPILVTVVIKERFLVFVVQSLLFQLALAYLQGSCDHSKISIFSSIQDTTKTHMLEKNKKLQWKDVQFRHGSVQWQAFLLQLAAPQGSLGPQRGTIPHPENDRASGKDWHCLHNLFWLYSLHKMIDDSYSWSENDSEL